ncbi:MAG: DoxX family protein [Pseudomonadota bacterium]|nr:DoxX family protein [Pseudomonadota bacterium]
MIDQKTAPYAALLLRVSLGIMFIAHGLLKLMVFTLPGAAAFFHSLGLPGWLAYVVTFAELAAGVALIIGFKARYVALVLIPDLLGAILLVHGANGWLFTNKGGGWEYPAFWAVALFVQFLLGDGAMAVSPSHCCSGIIKVD